jgi:hypothetical protein
VANPKGEDDWNYEAVPNEPLESLRCNYICLSQLLQKHISEKYVHQLRFSRKVFCSRIFFDAVFDGDRTLPNPLDLYFRNVDVFILFEDGRILMLYEREAEKVLHKFWAVKGKCSNAYLHLSSVRQTSGAGTIPMSLPVGNQANPCGSVLTSMQLFSGETSYDSEKK